MNHNQLYDFSIDNENRTVHIVRAFGASLDLVWDAWTISGLLDQWWAPKPFASKTKVMHFEEGGRRVYAMVSPEGYERWAIQSFSNIQPKTHFSMNSVFADKDENPDPPGSYWNLSFSEQAGTTKVRIAIQNESLERMEKMIEMGFREGFAMCLQQLDELLTALA